jgi:D-cysteine desulfhydrase
MTTRLHERFPGLDLGHVRLGAGPTPVRRLEESLVGRDGVEVWLKDEGAFGDGPWGGNKVRKLEWILPEAQRRGERVLFSVGGIGTHWGLTLATYSRRLGLETLLGLVDQPVDDHVREQLARLLTSGAEIHRFASTRRLKAAAPWLLWRGHRGRRLPWYLPAGGSNAFGATAYVEVALEIADQVAAGELPEPAVVAVPVGSGGTVAGLALGLRLAGLRSRVLGVVVNDALPLDGPAMAGLVGRTADLLTERGASGLPRITPDDLDLRADWLGRTYGDPTPASVAAVRDAEEAGLTLEPVYTGKTLAALRDLAGTTPGLTGPVLWLQTHGPR